MVGKYKKEDELRIIKEVEEKRTKSLSKLTDEEKEF